MASYTFRLDKTLDSLLGVYIGFINVISFTLAHEQCQLVLPGDVQSAAVSVSRTQSGAPLESHASQSSPSSIKSSK